MNKIRKGDTVRVLAGDDRGKTGPVNSIQPKKGLVIVGGINLIWKHQRRTGDARTQTGRIQREAALPLARVVLVCKSCGKATRVGIRKFDDGTSKRVCKKCGEVAE